MLCLLECQIGQFDNGRLSALTLTNKVGARIHCIMASINACASGDIDQAS